MSKCPNCNAWLPDEAHFCMHCFISLDAESTVTPTKKSVAHKSKIIHRKAFINCLIGVLAVTFLCVGGLALKKAVRLPVDARSDAAVVVPVTDESGETLTNVSGDPVYQVVVPVTDTDGGIVTNKGGETVYEVVTEITKTNGETTTKKSFLRSFFERDEPSTTSVPTINTTVLSSSVPSTTASSKAPKTTEDKLDLTDASANATDLLSTTPATTASANAPNPTEAEADLTETEAFASLSTVSPQTDFEFVKNNELIQINKYIGNSKDVVVPSKIEGINVGFINSKAFSDNSNIRSIAIESGDAKLVLGDGSFGSDKGVFNNLPNLKSLTLPSTVQEVMNFTSVINGCPGLEEVNVSGSSVYRSVDGVVFSNKRLKYVNANTLVYYPHGKRTSSYSVPSFCTDINGGAVIDNPYLNTFTVSSSPQKPDELYRNFRGCTSLYAIYTDTDSQKVKSVDGVLYVIDVYGFSDGLGINNGKMNYYTQVVYPCAKTGSFYEFAGGYKIMLAYGSFCGNAHLQSVKLPMYSRFDRDCYTGTYSAQNLKTFYLSDCDDSREFADRYKNVFKDVSVLYY